MLLLATNTLLALPSVVVGLSVYLLLSRAGPLGHWGPLFTPAAMVVAQTRLVLPLVLPLVVALTRQLVADAMHGNAEQLRSMGASPLLTALLLLVHERSSLATVLLTAFGRAVSEVGAVMIVGGNIDGVTRVMTTAIALETSKGDLLLARAWAVRLQLLFLDEPTASRDPAARREVEVLIDEFADEGMTLVMSTHHLGQARRLAARVLCLDGTWSPTCPVQAFSAAPCPRPWRVSSK